MAQEILFPGEIRRVICVDLKLDNVFIQDVRAGTDLCPASRAASGSAVPVLRGGVNSKATAGVSKRAFLISSDKCCGAPDLWPHFTGH